MACMIVDFLSGLCGLVAVWHSAFPESPLTATVGPPVNYLVKFLRTKGRLFAYRLKFGL